MMRCNVCASIFPKVFPSPETLAEAYAVYYTTAKSRRGWRLLGRRLLDRTRTRHIRRSIPKSASSVLDYGCGSGEYLQALAAENQNVMRYGTDLKQVDGSGGAAFKWLSLEEWDKQGNGYDWITLSHVIEHLAEPRAVLTKLRSAVRAGAETGVWISTPNADSVLLKAFGEYARDLDFPRHRQIYSRACLAAILEANGFRVTFDVSPRADTILNFVSCLKNLIRDPGLAGRQKVRIMARAACLTIRHILKPANLRAADSAEIVAIARPA